jgi:hypothetical protein
MLSLAAVIALVVLTLTALTPFPSLALRIVTEEFFPSMISWDGKTAWRRCDGAIAGEASWPATASAACEAMHLCANEAPIANGRLWMPGFARRRAVQRYKTNSCAQAEIGCRF